MARTEHFIGLEWLRFLLAIYVVLFHTVHAYVEDEPTWLSELAGVGFFATSSFFVLPAFCWRTSIVGRANCASRRGISSANAWPTSTRCTCSRCC